MIALGIDIGGTRIKAGLVDRTGNVLGSYSMPTPGDLAGMRRELPSLLQRLGDQLARVEGVGICCRGIIHPETTEVERLPGAAHFLEGFRLSSLLGDGLPARVSVRGDNDARAALAGEVAFGAARGYSNALMLTLGTGVGGAVLAQGQILRGARGVAGHFGHLTMDPDGPLCLCGNRGCLETYFSARAMEADILAGLHRGVASSLQTREQNSEPVCCEEIFRAAAAGDMLAILVRDRAIHYLGAAVAGLLHAFDPEVVIIGGQIVQAGAAILEPLKKELGWRTHCLLGEEVPVVTAAVSDQSGVAGAAALIFRS